MKKIETIAIIGATGATGLEVCRWVSREGYKLVALARTPSAFPLSSLAEVRRADVTDRASLAESLTGVDAVISCFGVAGLRRALAPTTLYSEGTRNLIAAMADRGIERLVSLSSAGVLHGKTNGVFWNYVLRPMCWRMYADVSQMELLIAQSRLDWTIIRPPQLTNSAMAVEARADAAPDGPTKLGRDVLAKFMVRSVQQEASFRKTFTVLQSFFSDEAP